MRKDVVLMRKICHYNEKSCRFNEKRSRYYEKICRFNEKRGLDKLNFEPGEFSMEGGGGGGGGCLFNIKD